MSTESKEALSRWLPTLVAIIAIIGNILWLGARAGAMEQRIATNEIALTKSITRAEYDADKRAATVMNDDTKQALRDINAKLDRLIEQRIKQ